MLSDNEKAKKLSYPQKIEIFMGVLEGIKKLHQKRLCFRNIKPENIGVCINEKNVIAKLMNFSKCKELDKYQNHLLLQPY